MTIPSSGPVTFTDIQTEFGGTNPIALNEYYAGGGLVPAGTTGTYGAVPSSGQISVQNFYGTSALIPIYIEEVFQTWLYNGTGSAQTITNGIDFSTNGGLLWFKARNDTRNNWLYDTNRGYQYGLRSDLDFAESTTPDALTAFNSNGFSIGTSGNINTSGNTLVSWSFRQQPKFFDVVTYTGAGTANPSNISHNLGSTPGFIMIKHYSASGNNWICYHTSLGNTQGIILNGTGGAITSSNLWNNTSPTSSQFTVGTSAAVNGSGSYVAYLFASNAGGFGVTGSDNVVTCGSFSGNTTVNLGFEPQWILLKRSSGAERWYIIDNMRGWPVSGDANYLAPNTSDAESQTSQIYPNATGFSTLTGGGDFIYVAIRRGPMKVPTLGTTVYNPTLITATQSTQNITSVGFSPDLIINGVRSNANYGQQVTDRLRGVTKQLFTEYESAENTTNGTALVSLNMNGFTLGADTGGTGWNAYSGFTSVKWNFKRAPNFFDEVCYTGTGTSNSSVNHNLGVVPELFFVKRRNSGGSGDVNWGVYSKDRPSIDYNLILNSTTGWYNAGTNGWFGTGTLSSTLFPSGNASANFGNLSGGTYVAYLFATCAGVSKVGSYTGTGALLTVNCGFSSGARFVLIKRTDSTGDWYVWDSARGISSGNDPYLLLNSASAEVTGTNYVDTTSVGFQITAAAPSAINASGGSYIFLAIA